MSDLSPVEPYAVRHERLIQLYEERFLANLAIFTGEPLTPEELVDESIISPQIPQAPQK